MPDESLNDDLRQKTEARQARIARRKKVEAHNMHLDILKGKIDRTITRLTRQLNALTKLRRQARRAEKAIEKLNAEGV